MQTSSEGSETQNDSRREDIRRYAIATLLTCAVFGLGYICGQKTERQDAVAGKASGFNGTPSRASVRSDALKPQQLRPRKAALIV